jgi:hypothetical protein
MAKVVTGGTTGLSLGDVPFDRLHVVDASGTVLPVLEVYLGDTKIDTLVTEEV